MQYKLAWIVIGYLHVLYAYRLTQKIHKKFGHVSDMSGEFPNRPGSHLHMQNPALEFIKCVCKVGDCSAHMKFSQKQFYFGPNHQNFFTLFLHVSSHHDALGKDCFVLLYIRTCMLLSKKIPVFFPGSLP